MTVDHNTASGSTGPFYARNNIFGPNCTVFVDNLSSTVAEAKLFKTFNQVGVISSARVVRDQYTGKSLGQAYLNFVNPVDANKALKTMSGKLIDGCPVRIRRKKKETNVFVKNIPQEAKKKDFEAKFAEYGKVVSCLLMHTRSEPTVHKGYGYVRFATQGGADNAVDAANSKEGIVIKGKVVQAYYYQTWKERIHEMSMNAHTFTSVHMRGYPLDWGKKEIEKILSVVEAVKTPIEVELTVKREEEKPYSYATVTFDEHEDAVDAIKELNKRRIDDNHTLVVERVMSNFEKKQAARKEYLEQKNQIYQKYKGRNLYVKNFPLDWDRDQLHALFSKYGTVSSAKVMKTSTDASRGFGFVCFESPDSAIVAMTTLNNAPIAGKPLVVNFAEPKEARKARLWGTQGGGSWGGGFSPKSRGRGGYRGRGAYRGRYRGRGRSRGRSRPWTGGIPAGMPFNFSQFPVDGSFRPMPGFHV